MSVYTIEISKSDFSPLSEMTNREIRTWRGLKSESDARYVTDGTILVDRDEVEDQDLLDEFLKREDEDTTIPTSTTEDFLGKLRTSKRWVGDVRGQVTRPAGMGSPDGVDATWIAVVAYRNYQEYCIADALALRMTRDLIGNKGQFKVSKHGETLSWWKDGNPIAAVATFDFFGINLVD